MIKLTQITNIAMPSESRPGSALLLGRRDAISLSKTDIYWTPCLTFTLYLGGASQVLELLFQAVLEVLQAL